MWKARKRSISLILVGWWRELWLEAFGLKAVLPAPEERMHVKTAVGAARAPQSRKAH